MGEAKGRSEGAKPKGEAKGRSEGVKQRGRSEGVKPMGEARGRKRLFRKCTKKNSTRVEAYLIISFLTPESEWSDEGSERQDSESELSEATARTEVWWRFAISKRVSPPSG